jgi:sugar lactone lactonase YvrE
MQRNRGLLELVAIFSLIFCSSVVAQNYTIQQIAGNGQVGLRDGQGNQACFQYPIVGGVDSNGVIIISEWANNDIRKATSTGVVTTVNSIFNGPTGCTLDSMGNIWVTEGNNLTIRMIAPNGQVSTIAGNGTPGFSNGVGTNATFKYPVSVAVDTNGNAFVVDQGNYSIRKISKQGNVMTLAGNGTSGFVDGSGNNAQFVSPGGICIGTDGSVYVSDTGANAIRKISPLGTVTTLAGNGSAGQNDGQGTNATFYQPSSIAIDSNGNIYVSDFWNAAIRKVSPTGNVSTVINLGFCGGGIAVDSTGIIYTSDYWNQYVYKIIPSIPAQSTDTLGTGTNQFGIDFVTIGNPGNSNDTTGYGGVPYTYRIGKYTISQNQIDAATRNGLQNVTAGAWSGDQPAGNISWYEAAAYVNWLNISQGYRPAYNLTFTNGAWSMALWPTSPDTNGNFAWTLGGTNLFRNGLCHYFLPSENEWYKAAYYDPNKNGGTGGYWLYPTGSDSAPTPVTSGNSAGTAVYQLPPYHNYDIGPASVFQSGGLSFYGTMGQSGNVFQWEESAWDGDNNNEEKVRGVRSGYWSYDAASPPIMPSTFRPFYLWPNYNSGSIGFRIASVDDSWLTNGLVAYYPFEGDAKDASGNANDGIGQGATLAPDRFGSQSSTYFFDGNSSIDLTALNKYELGKPKGQITTSFWFLATGNGPILGDYMGSPNSGDDVFTLLISVDRNRLSVSRRHYPAHSLDYTLYVSTNPITDGRWHHCITVADGSGALRVNLDGVNVANLLYDSNLDDVQDSKWQAGYVLFKGENQFFHGKLDDVRIYNRALSSNEVAQLYALENTPPPTFGPTNSQSISFPTIPTLTLTNGTYTLGATSSFALPVTYTIGDSTVAGITNGTLIPLGVGTTTVVASQAGDTNYLPATPVTNTLVVTLAQQSVTPSPVATRTYGSLPYGLTLPTNASGLPITARIVSGPATLSGTNIILTGSGTVTLAYEAPGNDLYAAASVTNTFSVTNGPTNLKSQTITFKALAAKPYGSAPQALAGSASSKLPVTYWSSNTNVAVINGTNAVITGAGSTVITAYQPGDGSTFNPAAPVSQTLLVNQSSQKLTLKAPKSVAYGSTPAAITATSSAGLPVTLTSSDTTIATITNSGTNTLLVPTGVGTITLTSTQAGNTNVGAAIPVGQAIVISPGIQTITFAALGTNTYGATPITLTATSSAGLLVTFTASATNVASISGNTLTITGAGSAKITASQAGSKLWAPAKAVTQSLTVAKASQTISFSIPTTVTYSKGGLVTLGATATSGLPVAYKSGNSKVLSITGSTCVITGKGTTTVVASQPGGANYLPALSITNTITVQ